MVEINRSSFGLSSGQLFQLFRDGQPHTKAELAELTGLARSTISLRLDPLIELGVISPAAENSSTGGRPSTQLVLNERAFVVAGVDFGASHAVASLADFSGKILASIETKRQISDGPEVCLRWMIAELKHLLAGQGIAEENLLAIGIGLPGPVEHSTGKPASPPIMMGWDAFDVPARVNQDFNAKVLVDNDVNVMALGERYASYPDVDHLIFLKAATGIGSGIISGGQLQRGAQGTAGDIGHVRVSSGGGVSCHCGNFGCLEAVASAPAIIKKLVADGLPIRNSSDLIDATKRAKVEAIQAVRQAGRDIGEVLSTCVSLINPAVIVIGGSLASAGEHLIAGVREVVYARSMPLASENLLIVQSKVGKEGGIIGANVMAIDYVLDAETIDSMVNALITK
ncbi:ROK family transcriptional regulator [Rhodoluna lacicola]|uniref:Transcriptional regulator/sugar kinase n=1 Tax=Rhodoluna lacicola TaxID=529884 RepID=A0A060JDT2_9MICO|nr:ROK family transcriptional regulator [Rhodoluna lacicola]AIC46925.1 Transcriptional regulator/sugar kinase [Rhodoluna lacicola]